MFRRNNPSIADNIALRETGAALQNWRYERQFAAIYPRAYYDQKATTTDWRSACRSIVSFHSALLFEPQRTFIEAILDGDVNKCTGMLPPNMREAIHLEYISRLFTNRYIATWIGLNAFSANQPHFSIEIRDMIWRFISSSITDAEVLLQFAVITYQPVSTFAVLLDSIPGDELNMNKILYDCLVTATKFNQIDMAKYLLNVRRVNPDLEGGDESPLTQAAGNSNSDMVALLLRYQANISSITYTKFQPIHLAAQAGNSEIVRLLLQHGANVNGNWETYQQGWNVASPIEIACKQGNLEMVKLLVDNGDTLYSVIHGKYTFEWACLNGHYHVADYLLQQGADINANVKRGMLHLRNGYKILHLACKPENSNIELAKYLIKNGADINSPDEGNTTPVHLACKGEYNTYFLHYLLYETNANWFYCDEDGYSPFYYLKKNGMDRESLILILEHFVNHLDLSTNHFNYTYHSTPVTLSSLYTNQIVKLCANNPDLLLQYAIISQQNLAEIHRIISMGATVSGTAKYLHTPYDLAEKLHPDAIACFNELNSQPGLSQDSLGGFGFFDVNLDESDLAKPEEINQKKRNRE